VKRKQKKNKQLNLEKQVYKSSFDQLRKLKTEIETIQKMLEVGRARLQSDFDAWYDHVLKSTTRRSSTSGAKISPRAAWTSIAPTTAPSKTDSSVCSTVSSSTDDDIAAFYRAKEELAQLRAKR